MNIQCVYIYIYMCIYVNIKSHEYLGDLMLISWISHDFSEYQLVIPQLLSATKSPKSPAFGVGGQQLVHNGQDIGQRLPCARLSQDEGGDPWRQKKRTESLENPLYPLVN